jgi:hypothetical protein
MPGVEVSPGGTAVTYRPVSGVLMVRLNAIL